MADCDDRGQERNASAQHLMVALFALADENGRNALKADAKCNIRILQLSKAFPQINKPARR
jgi:hypothetical protein